MRRRQFATALVGSVALAGCSGDSDSGSDSPATPEGPVPDLSVENSRESSISGHVLVEQTGAGTSDVERFATTFDLSPGERRAWADVATMGEPAEVAVTADDGVAGSYGWDGSGSFNRGLVAVVERDGVAFAEEVA